MNSIRFLKVILSHNVLIRNYFLLPYMLFAYILWVLVCVFMGFLHVWTYVNVFYGIYACMNICVCISCDFSLTLFPLFVSSYSTLVGFVFQCPISLLLLFRCLFF